MATEQPWWHEAHETANQAGSDGYVDPRTGLFVMTRGYLERRGTCCANECRHCPYDCSIDAEVIS